MSAYFCAAVFARGFGLGLGAAFAALLCLGAVLAAALGLGPAVPLTAAGLSVVAALP